MARKLEGRVAIVTGASKGIGAEIAKALAAEGAEVVVNFMSSKSGADRVVAEINAAKGRAVAIQADMSKHADIVRLFADTKKQFGRLDVLVNNAGIYDLIALEDVTEEAFYRHYALNVLGPLLAAQESLKYFGNEGGSIINIGSGVTSATPPKSTIYGGTKGALNMLTRSLSKELGSRNIRVNSVNPGMTETEGTQLLGPGGKEIRGWVEAMTPLGRIGRTDDISPAVVFFASPDSKFITGEIMLVAGGMS